MKDEANEIIRNADYKVFDSKAYRKQLAKEFREAVEAKANELRLLGPCS